MRYDKIAIINNIGSGLDLLFCVQIADFGMSTHLQDKKYGPNSYNNQGSSLVNVNISIAPNVYMWWLYEQRESGLLNLHINSEVNSPVPSTIKEMLTSSHSHNKYVNIMCNTIFTSYKYRY